MFVIINNTETEVFPVLDEDGEPEKEGNGFAYVTEDGERVTVVFDPASDSGGLPRPPTADDDGSLWSAAKTRFFIGAYKTLKDRLRIKGGFRTKRALWQELADTVIGEFGGVITAEQAQNKWKSLERAYKKAKAKNQSSGHSRVHFEFEDELHDILEREHHITPTVLLAPGKVMGTAEQTDTQGETSRGAAPGSQSGASPLPSEGTPNHRATGTPSKRKRETVMGSLLRVFTDMEAGRMKRHNERMTLLARLVSAVERNEPME